MLKIVRKAIWLAILLVLAAAVTTFAGGGEQAHERELAAEPSNPQPSSGNLPSGAAPGPAAGQSRQRILQTVVLDPAHGGTDEGAHGAGGIVEKKVVLALAKVVQARLEQDGLRVVMTRQDDQTLSFEQRAAIANAQNNAIFISLHVGSSGQVGSANVYYYDFNQVMEAQPEAPAAGGWVYWDRAQLRWTALSQRLAQLLQVEIAERLRGSPELPTGAPVYQLREIAEPAVAIEIENVNAPSAAMLDALGTPLAEAISRAIQAFRIVYQRKTP